MYFLIYSTFSAKYGVVKLINPTKSIKIPWIWPKAASFLVAILLSNASYLINKKDAWIAMLNPIKVVGHTYYYTVTLFFYFNQVEIYFFTLIGK
jgi:hypothetical protein